MQKKILMLGVGAFGFAILEHLAKHHPSQTFFAHEKNQETLEYLMQNRKHPYFSTDIPLRENIVLISDLVDILPSLDILILAIPNQFIRSSIEEISSLLKPGVIIVNLSKGIDNNTLATVSDTLKQILGDIDYRYATLSGGMIAQELIDGQTLGAQIGVSDESIAGELQELFQSETLQIDVTTNYRDIELYGALKNIIALYTGYLEEKGYGYSSIGFFLCELLRELPILMKILGGTGGGNFYEYALGGDIVATSFGNSRNRYFGRLVGEGNSPDEVYMILRSEKKHAEGYETLKGVRKHIHENAALPRFREIERIFLGE